MRRRLRVETQLTPRPSLSALAMADILPWSLLDAEARPIFKEFVASWEALLRDRNSTEHNYHKFIAEQPAFFFLQEDQVVSKPELGSEHQADFVLAADQMSAGIHYRFIEIESPHAVAYTASGNPSARLTHAIQQVMDWKRWIKSNRGQYKKLFPSNYLGVHEFDNLSYCVYIGRRDQSPRLTALRNEYAKEVGIGIRSYDSLLDRLINLGFWDLVTPPEVRGRT
ncbi:MAG: Shedu anti-phage system protein SduA domain-containing protein [Terriglobia bacterium]